MPFFCLAASLVMTAPLFISDPVPKMVTTAPMGMPSVENSWSESSIFHTSRSVSAWTETIFTQPMTLPPPTARMKSTPFSRARRAPSWTLA